MLYRRRTPAQIAASRRNGALSRGPVTPEGKRNSARTAIPHLAGPNLASYAKAAKFILLPGESEAEFARVAQQLELRFLPRDEVEAMLVQRMIVAQWQIIRTWNFERLALLATPADDSENPALRSLGNFLDLHTQSRAGSAFQLTAQRYQRQFEKAVSLLNQIRGNINFRPSIPTSNSKQMESVESPEPTDNPSDPTTDPTPSHPDLPRSQPDPNPVAPISPASDQPASEPGA